MPVPTPPNKDLFKVVALKKTSRSKKVDKKVVDEKTTPMAFIDVNGTEFVRQVKKQPFVPTEHLTHHPFREDEKLRKLGYQLKKETEKKKSVRHAPKRASK